MEAVKLFLYLTLLAAQLPFLAAAGELAGYKLLVTSARTGDTEVFIADPDTGDNGCQSGE